MARATVRRARVLRIETVSGTPTVRTPPVADERPRVLVVEEARPRDAALAGLLPDERFEVFAGDSLERALQRLAGRGAAVVVLDLTSRGPELVADVVGARRRLPEVPMLVVGRSCCNRCALDALHAGAEGYLCRREVGRGFADAVEETRHGGAPMSPVIARFVRDELRRHAAPTAVTAGPLTPKEVEVVNLLASGARYADVASALDLSINTVRTHVRAIYAKLDVGSRTEAVLSAIERGLVRRR